MSKREPVDISRETAAKPAEKSEVGQWEPSVDAATAAQADVAKPQGETGGPAGPEPTRYGDWERKGRCIDF